MASRSTCPDEVEFGAPSQALGEPAREPDATRPVTILAPRRLGTTEVTVHPIGLDVPPAGDRTTSRRLLDEFRAAGGSFVAASGGANAAVSQEAIGTWLGSRQHRDELTVAVRIGSTADAPGLGPVSLVRAVEAALRRLDVDCLDLVLFDGEDADVALDDTLATASWLRQAGKVRFFGAQNVSAEFLLEARILAGAGMPHLQAFAAPYSVGRRDEFEGKRQWAVSAQRLGLLPMQTMRGLGDEPAGADPTRLRSRAAEALGRRSRVLGAVDRVAAAHGVAPATIGVAWALNRRTVAAPLVAPESVGQLRVALAATAVPLTRSQLRELDRAAGNGAV